jgi:hypothetical protein
MKKKFWGIYEVTANFLHLPYIDVLRKDTCLSSVEEIRTAMLELDVWRGVVADWTKKPT